MLLSAAGIVLLLIAWVMHAIFQSFSSAPDGGVQKLMDPEKQEKHDDES
jgi:multisubunit Na+/H+ antiporter MnhB subunit